MNNLALSKILMLNLLCCLTILILPIQQDTVRKVKCKKVYQQHLARQTKDLKKFDKKLDSLMLVLKIDTTKSHGK